MALSQIQRVRNAISDRAQLHRERYDADGTSDRFKLKYEPVNTSPAPQIWANDVLQTEGVDYTVSYEHGIISFTNAPALNAKLIFQYYAVVWTDVEIQDFLDQHGDVVNIAAGHLLFAWSADVAKVAKRETLSGGGGLGAVTRDTSVAARELRNSAQALLDWEREYGVESGTAVPAEGFTEIPWTEAAFEDIEEQTWIREN